MAGPAPIVVLPGHAQLGPHRQSRRNRLPHRAHSQRARHAHHCGLFVRGRAGPASAPLRRGPSHRPRGTARELSRRREIDRSREEDRSRMRSPRLRVPVRERGFRRGLRPRRSRIRRSACRGDPRDGAQGPRQGADGESRRSSGARLSRRPPGREIPQGESLRDRLPGADQAGGGRRRARDAARR